MDVTAFRVLRDVYFIALVLGALVLCFNPNSHRDVALLLYAVFAIMSLYHKRYYGRPEGSQPKGKWVLVGQFAVALCIQYFDNTRFEGFYYIILISVALLTYEKRFSIPYSLTLMTTNMVMQYYKSAWSTWPEFLANLDSLAFLRLFFIATIAIFRYTIEVSRKNRQLAESLRGKNVELEAALDQLAANVVELKEAADLRARERLMRELHDKLGYLLTSASINAQAVGVLLEKDAVTAKTHLNITAEQIQAALKAMRDVISGRSLEFDERGLKFGERLLSLVNETEKQTGIFIIHNLAEQAADRFEGLSTPIQSLIYHAVMEGLTNGIRHGGATRFELSLTAADNRIDFVLQDNGTGFTPDKFGCGLSKMRQDALRFGGQFAISGQNGVILKISLPTDI